MALAVTDGMNVNTLAAVVFPASARKTVLDLFKRQNQTVEGER